LAVRFPQFRGDLLDIRFGKTAASLFPAVALKECIIQLGTISSHNHAGDNMATSILKKILTDWHFWIPATVLILGIAVLILIR
jgi:hypothetical protein